MRILHAVVAEQLAGVERYVARLAAAQARAGHHVLVAGGPAAGMVPEPVRGTAFADADGAASGPVGGAGTLAHVPAATTRALATELRRRAGQVDVLHVHMTAAEVAAALALTALPGHRPLVVSTRHFARRRGHGATGLVTAAVARRAVDVQIAISDHVAAAVDGACTVVRTGIEDRPDAPGADGRHRTVLLVQRLQPEKRGDVAVEAFARSGLAQAGWRLDVVGDGAERAALEELSTALGLGAVTRFLGTRDDVAARMRTAGVLLAPCPVEGLGLSVLEAMASGLPVVAAAAGGHLELLDGVDDLCLAPPLDAGATARALAALAADPLRRDGAASRALARQRERLTLRAQVDGVLAVYDTALHDARAVAA